MSTAVVEGTRERILKAAADVFREHGFHAAGMREIADRLEMTPGSLYYHFESKTDLLYECQRIALRSLLAGAREVEGSTGTASAKLAEVVRRHVRCLLVETGGSAAHLEFRALPTPQREAIAKQRRAYERVVRGIVAKGTAAGELRRVDARLATLAVLGALNATVTWWLPDGPKTPDEIADAYASTLVAGLLPRRGS